MLGPLKAHRPRRRGLGFTLIEVMIAVAVAAVVLVLATPAFNDYILRQRLMSVNAQLVTDIELARSEATSRNNYLRLVFGSNASVTCYTLYTSSINDPQYTCNCTLGAGQACTTNANTTEVKTTVVDRSLGVTVLNNNSRMPTIAFDPVTGMLYQVPADDFMMPLGSYQVTTRLDASRSFVTTISTAGRVSVCATAGGLGAAPC